ncbi:hypothetical protein LSCM1_07361 [Leishmania martiniquensis]|uniref:Vacuolar membrane-associated protein Iml1 N-terminal domain-containing protein n=1 Tax=Leishmania martiniquensis TaxID=1580590 RepID=A0A836H5H4_9TRYP|nr:hypothetical protein LSCM1_07361 [Leishmania martiniquensis]
MKGASLRRQQRHSHQPNASQGSDAPVSLVFRTHGDSLSKAAFLFCPKNFNLANPVSTAGSAAAAPSTSSPGSPSSVNGLPPLPGRHGNTASPQLAGSPEGRRFCSAASSSAAAESVQTLVEAIVELRPFFAQPVHQTHSVYSSGAGSNHNVTGLAPNSPLAGSTGDGTLSALGLTGRAASNSSVGAGSHVDLMALSPFVSPTSGGNFSGGGGGGEGGSAFSAAAAGGHSGMLGNSSLAGSPLLCGVSSAVTGATGAGSGAAGGGVAAGTNELCLRMHPSGGWICRAMAFNEKEVSHANGAISVNQSLTSKCALINEVAKGKIMARILSSYQDVHERYGLSHVEVTVANQYLSRSDMFLISEALRERILYEGEETHLCGFRIRVREMLQAVATSPHTPPNHAAMSAAPAALSGSFFGVNGLSAAAAPAGVSACSGPASPLAAGFGAGGNAVSMGAGFSGAAGAGSASVAGAVTNIRVGCGIVLPTTRINFQSLSPVHYILLELSCEMWETTMDGRIALTLAIRKFLSELLLKQLPKRKASPRICVVFTGRLRTAFRFGRHSDIFHVLELPRDLRSNVDIVEEIRMHCEALVDRVLREVQSAAWRQLEAEVRAYREAAVASYPRTCAAKSAGNAPANDGDVASIDPQSPREGERGKSGATTNATRQLPTASETLKGARGSGAVSAATAGAATTEAALDAYVRSRLQCIDGITAKQLFVHAKQSNTLEALSIVLERCTHHCIDRNLTLCGHAVTVVSAGKGLYQVTNNLVQIVCARLHDMGLEKVHVICVGRPPLHVTPLLEYTSHDDTLRSQYHLQSCVLSGAGVGVRGTAGGAPTQSLASGGVERYYEMPEWMTVFFFHSSLQHTSGGETVFELLPKECWQREHSVTAALRTLWPTPPQPHLQARQQQFRSPSVSALLPGGAGGDAGEEGGSASAGADAASSVRGRYEAATAATPMGYCRNRDVAAGEGSLTGGNPPLLIPGLGLRSYPLPVVTLPVHPHSIDWLRYTDGWGARTHEQHPVRPAGATTGLPPVPGGIGGVPIPPLAPLHPQPYPGDAGTGSWTGIIGAEHALSPTSPFCGVSGKAAVTSWLGAAASLPTVSKRSSPLLVRATTNNSSSFFASPTTPAQGSIPCGLMGTGTLGAQVAAWQQAQLQQGLQPLFASSTFPQSSAYTSLQQHTRKAQVAQTFSSALSTAAGAQGGDIGSSETASPSAAAALSGAQQRRSRGAAAAAPVAVRHHLAAPSGNAGHHTTMMAVSGPASGSGRLSDSMPCSYAASGKPALHVSRSFDHKRTSNLEHHSLGTLENSVRSVGSSLLGLHNSAPRLQSRSLLWREGSTTKSSHNSIVNAAAAAAATTTAGTDPGVSGINVPGGLQGVGGGLRSVQLRLEDGKMYRDVMGVALSFASCAWYCLHSSKLHQDSVGGTATLVMGLGVAAASAPVAHAIMARQIGGSGNGAAAAALAGGLPFSTGAAVDLGLRQQRDGQPPTLAERAAGTASGRGGGGPSLQPAGRRWHKAPSGTRSDAVFCGCNVVDSDLRRGYLILEITINAAVLPQSFWSPRLLLDDSYWAHLMSCFTGRDDRLTLEDELHFISEEDTDDDDALTIGGSSTDGHQSPLNGSGGRRWREAGSGGSMASLAAAATVATGGRETGGGTCGVPESGGAGDVYHFQSDFRPAEVFCRSHSGITADGRTLIIPTHANSVHFQSSEEILLRFSPRLFVSTVDEVGGGDLDQPGLTTVTSPNLSGTVTTQEEAHIARHSPHRGGGGEGLSSVAAGVVPTGRQGDLKHLEKNEEGSCEPSGATGSGAAVKTATTAATEDGGASTSPHTPRPGVVDAPGKRGDDNGVYREAASHAKTTKSIDAAAPSPTSSHSAPASGSARAGAEAMETEAGGICGRAESQAQPAAVKTTAPRKLLDAPADGTDPSTKSATQSSRPWPRPMLLRLTATVTSSPVSATGAPPSPLPLLRAHALPIAATSRQVGSSIAGPPASSPTPTTVMHSAGQYLTHSTCRYDEVPLMPGTTVTVGFVQLRNSLLFAIKPIDPLRHGSEEEQREDVTALSQSAESVSTATVLRRRWQWKHPDIASEPPHLASWTRLCTCRLLPLYGGKPAYPREGFYTVSPHQYTVTSPGGSSADPSEEKKRLLEFVLQRLQQQYQIVADSPGLIAGSQWPRADPSPNTRLEMSLGHQTHTLKVGETAKTISVTRMLHRGMYSNGQVTHMLSYRYLLWNYLTDEFTTCEVHMEAQVGERNAFRWESLDGWLQERPKAFIPRGPDVWLRSREVAVALLPEDAAHPPSYEDFCRFISYRFSVHLSPQGKAVWRRKESGVTLDISAAMPLTFAETPPLMDVALVHDNPLALDTRNVIDRVTGRTVGFEVPVQERLMSVDISLPQEYSIHCCYFLKVSWLACAASIVVDWLGSFIANAARYHFHAVPLGCYYNSPKVESLTAHYDVEASSPEEEPALRRALVELLMTPAYQYYPDTPVVTRNCRLVHFSGLCSVIVPPSATTVAQWYQNAFVRQGSVEQLELLAHFKRAVASARERVADMAAGSVSAAGAPHSTAEHV